MQASSRVVRTASRLNDLELFMENTLTPFQSPNKGDRLESRGPFGAGPGRACGQIPGIREEIPGCRRR